MRDEVVLNKIKEVIVLLDEIDTMIEEQSQELQKVDYELSDLYHYIENENISTETSVKLIERIKYLRLLRKSLNIEYAIEKAYKDNSSKMMGNNTRSFLLNSVCKARETYRNNEYKNRVLTDEDITELEITEKKKRGRPPKKKVGDLNE